MTGVADELEEARALAYERRGPHLASRGARYRTDIAPAGGEPRWLTPLVGILVGSESDRERMQAAMDELDARGIAHEFEVRSAHRDAGRRRRVREVGAATAGCGC